MAQRANIKISNGDESYTLNGYRVSDDVGLVLLDDIGWVAIHLRTGYQLTGKRGAFKQKRQALAYAEHLVASGIDWNFETIDEMFQVNDRERLIAIYHEAVEKGLAV